jgi:HD-GYP domain-containing protein (c-di-GMP phosphodiesterase class II)
MGGLLHDVGMACLEINKTSKYKHLLPEGNKQSLDDHVVLGIEKLNELPDIPEEVMIMASQHHECIDGSGFPNALSGDDIHLFGRMLAIANSFDAWTSEQPDGAPLSPKAALKKLLEQGGKMFDTELVQKFILAIGIYPVGTTVELQDGSIAVVAENDSKALLKPIVNIVYDKQGNKSDRVKKVDLKGENNKSPLQIKRVTKVKHTGFDPMDALLALRENS